MIIILALLFSFVFPFNKREQPVWVTSSYFRAGNQDVISEYTGSADGPSFYTFTFSSSLTGVPELGYGIKNYEADDYMVQEKFQIQRLILTASTFQVKVTMLGTTNMWILNVPYIAVDPSFPHHLNSFDNVPVNYPNQNLVNITVASSTVQTYINSINYTDQAALRTFKQFSEPLENSKILLFLTSFYIQGSFDPNPPYSPIDFHVSTAITSTSHYQITVTLSIQVKSQKIHFSQIIFDQEDVQASKEYVITYQNYDFDGTGGFIEVPQEFIDNFILGLVDFSTIRSKSVLKFNWEFATVSGTHGVLVQDTTPRSTLEQFGLTRQGINVFYIKTWQCPDLYSFDNTLNLCVLCDLTGCLECNNTNCFECNASANYYINETQFCEVCNISNCLVCQTLFKCQICDNSSGYYLNNTDSLCYLCTILFCLSCSTLYECETCNYNESYYVVQQQNNASYCEFCNSSLNQFINFTNLDCQPCTLNQCLTCSDFFACTQCNTTNNYFLNMTDSLCYQYQITFKKIYRSGCNSFSLRLEINSAITEQQIKKILDTLDISHPNISRIDKSYENRIITINVSYNGDIAEGTIPVVYSSVQFNVSYQPIVSSMYYSKEECQMVDNIETILQVVQIMSYAILFLSVIPSSKIIGLQLFGILQLSHFDLAHHDFLNLALSPLAKFKSFNGINLQITDKVPSNLLSLQISSSFLNNFNIMYLLLAVELILAVIILIISKIFRSKVLKKLALRLLKEGFLTLILFNCFNIAFSSGIHWKYAQTSDQFYVLSSVGLYVSLCCMVAVVFLLQATASKDYGEFKLKFKKNFVCRMYIALTLLFRISLGLYISLQNDYVLGTIIVVAFSLSFGMYNIINLPFNNVFHNYRASIIRLTQFIILMVTNYYRSRTLQTKSHDHTPAKAQIGMILICVAISLLVLVYDMVKFCKMVREKYCNKQKLKIADEQAIKKAQIEENMKVPEESIQKIVVQQIGREEIIFD